jgi:hypothetical protein
MNMDILYDQATLREMTKILKINTSVCSAVGGIFVHQLSFIFNDMLSLYTTYRCG